MKKHTPGPWRVFGGTDDDRGHVMTSDGYAVADCCLDYSSIPTREQLENARLIAAAPDLLAALKEIAEWTERYTTPGHPISTVARAAIAKATGGGQ